MKKILLIMLLLIEFSFANTNQNDNSFIKELGLNESFLESSSFKKKYRDLSSKKKLLYYDNLLKKSSLITNIVRERIEKESLPSFIFFIPLIESSYKNQITKGPSGLWQIMPLTANNLKLIRNEYVDERLDLLKATNAATNYLKKYYKKTNKWYLAAAYYNAGEGRILSGIARASLDNYLEKNPNMYHDKVIKLYNLYIHDYKKNKKGLHNLYTIYKDLGVKKGYFDYEYLVKNNKRDYFPKTTVNYINMIVSFEKLASEDRFKNIDKKTKYEIESINPPKGSTLSSIALALQMNLNELQNINKHLLKGVIPKDTKNYNFYIPHTKLSLFESNVLSIEPTKTPVLSQKVVDKKPNTKNYTTYIVKKGDSFSLIAKKHKISVKKLKYDNNKKTDTLKIGEKLEIYK